MGSVGKYGVHYAGPDIFFKIHTRIVEDVDYDAFEKKVEQFWPLGAGQNRKRIEKRMSFEKIKFYLNKRNWHWSILILLCALEFSLGFISLTYALNHLIHCLWVYAALRTALAAMWFYFLYGNIVILQSKFPTEKK